MATKYEYYDSSEDSPQAMASVNQWVGQTFTPSISHTITSVKLKLCRTGSPGIMTVSIKAVDGSGHPTGADLCSGTTNADTLTPLSTGETREITLGSGTALIASTKYAIVCQSSTNADGSNHVNVLMETGTGAYADGNFEWTADGGSNWSAGGGDDDITFSEWGGNPTPPSTEAYTTKQLIAIGSNQLWYESPAGTMIQLAASAGQLDTTGFLNMFEAFEKVFIVNSTNFKVADFGNTKITTTSIGTHPPDFSNVLTGGTSGAKMVVDYITTLSGACTIYGKRITSATFVDTETVTGTDDDGNAISFVLNANEVAPPHWYDWTVYGNDSSFGALPNQATLGCLWRGRIVLSGDIAYPHQWYQSRQRNPWDYNYISEDPQSPVAGGNADAGEVGDIVIALIPYNRDYLIYGCANSLWVLAGDACEGGSLYEFESTAGILGSRAWCWDKEERLYILTATGILRIPKGFGQSENLTEISYPDFIKDLAYDPSLHRITMGYDRERHGINISKTTLSDGSNSCWWYDLKTEGLFPDSYPTQCGIFSMFHYEANDPDYRKLLFGCNDGYIRFADDDAKDDDIGASNQAINSYITFGPLKLGREGGEGKINSLLGIPAGGLVGGSEKDSDDLYYKIWTGQTADIVTEKLIADTNPIITGTIEAQQYIRGKRKRRSVRGMFAGIRVGNDTVDETWSLERLLIDTRESGRI